MHNPILTLKVKRIEKKKIKIITFGGLKWLLTTKKKKKKKVKIVVDKSHMNQSYLDIKK